MPHQEAACQVQFGIIKLIVTCDKLTCKEGDKCLGAVVQIPGRVFMAKGMDDGQGRRASFLQQPARLLSGALFAKKPSVTHHFSTAVLILSIFPLLPPRRTLVTCFRGVLAVCLHVTQHLFHKHICWV